jgi:hypothetical protein
MKREPITDTELQLLKQRHQDYVEGMSDDQIIELYSDSPALSFFRLSIAFEQLKEALIDAAPSIWPWNR